MQVSIHRTSLPKGCTRPPATNILSIVHSWTRRYYCIPRQSISMKEHEHGVTHCKAFGAVIAVGTGGCSGQSYAMHRQGLQAGTKAEQPTHRAGRNKQSTKHQHPWEAALELKRTNRYRRGAGMLPKHPAPHSTRQKVTCGRGKKEVGRSEPGRPHRAAWSDLPILPLKAGRHWRTSHTTPRNQQLKEAKGSRTWPGRAQRRAPHPQRACY